MKLPGVISFRKLLPIWRSERELAAHGGRHVGEVHEDALGRLGRR